MANHQHGTLTVPGATLAYQIRGSGPLLLLIPGGAGGSDGYNTIAGYLSTDYSVVTYDRRGSYSSLLTQPVQEMDLQTHKR